jgi:hypothetical protein
MTEEQKQTLVQWARERCEAWNWNCNPAEIAKELIDTDIDVDGTLFDVSVDGDAFAVLQDEFIKFFPDSGENDIETIRQIIEVFG